MANCIFCQIVSGNIPSKKLFEDDKVMALLDIYPANPGHILLIPKEHYTFASEVPSDLFAHMGVISQRMSHILVTNLKAAGTTMIVQSGQDAGQKAPHFIMHIIPRAENDELNLAVPTNNIDKDDIDELYGKLRPLIAQTFPGQNLEEIEEGEAGSEEEGEEGEEDEGEDEAEEGEEDEEHEDKPDELLDKIEGLI
ncbi:MAG: HIT family protein [Nanoarchaeota archaeon]|nr:HIT family protein [Nanoarchaeota archaeon]